ncbi:MAG: 30S ribosome-binding factor RbfA [Clostridia bacterium]|nr:30S ribosome-binding factor RbfA [Clostridia bacterium]
MITRKMERVDSEVNKALGQIIQYELNDPRVNGVLITVLKSEVTKDMKYCKSFVSVYPIEKGKEILEVLNSSTSHIKKCLARKVLIRNIPQLTFILDTSAEYSKHINEIINNLKTNEGDKNV